jgi:hypothetical protein
VSSSQSVNFDLEDGTTVTVESDDLRRVYDELWLLSRAFPGAISTAALLLDEAGRHRRRRYGINLDRAQGSALTRALNQLAHA